MAEICCGVVSEEESPESSTSSQAARRRRMEIRRFKYVSGVSATSTPSDSITTTTTSSDMKRPRICDNACDQIDFNNTTIDSNNDNNNKSNDVTTMIVYQPHVVSSLESRELLSSEDIAPKYGIASVCGRRRDMEDAIAVHPSFIRREGSGSGLGSSSSSSELHYFGVYDGHGCSHVATKCKERLHEILKEELVEKQKAVLPEWKLTMEKSFNKMDKEVIASREGVAGKCRCEMQIPECDAVGSTAVVAVVTRDKIVVANCGDSRAVLCRNGKAVPLSSDHKPDRPDELNRIEEAGGRVIYWDGPRVLGVLAMSRAIGDNYLKPYVSSEPEVTITDRTVNDDCLILASDGLWDVVSNETACSVARMCLRGKFPPPEDEVIGSGDGEGSADKVCSDASMLLTKLALARHSADNVSVVVINLRTDT